MSAKDFKLCVSGLSGTPFISKVSKTNPNIMLSDRREIPDQEMYVAIEQFAKGRIAKGFSTLEVTANGKIVFEICFPNKRFDDRRAELRKQAVCAIDILNGYTPEQRSKFTDSEKLVEEFANYILELTN